MPKKNWQDGESRNQRTESLATERVFLLAEEIIL